MLTPPINSTEIAKLFSSLLVGFSIYWGILKSLQLFNKDN